MTDQPRISIVLCTYNRAKELSAAINSILCQTYEDFELVLVDNGSTDNTAKVIEEFIDDRRLQVFTLSENRGCSGGFNFGLDQIRGEWFATMCDDDILLDKALETLMQVVDKLDKQITAVTANCILKSTGELSGKGLNGNQYLDAETVITKCSGEFTGITRTDLLGDLRFNENLVGNADTLWYRIDIKANRYYIHKPIKIFNDLGDTISNRSTKDVLIKAHIYQMLLEDEGYWLILRKFHHRKYVDKCFKGWLFLKIAKNHVGALRYSKMLSVDHRGSKFMFLYHFLNLFGSDQLQRMFGFWQDYATK